ncbi:MAG: WecB/TagA/CpsF family glycosyltransferase [Lachnospiraceae bacterium]|nr:WecB/TagA/CpsF family glycosyltransferase [Lachnospiraceae bacterium]
MVETNIKTCKILGVNIAVVNMESLLKFITTNLDKLKGEYICVSNVHTTVMAFDNKEYLNVQNNSILSIPDGGPLSSVGRKRGYAAMQRTTGPDLLDEVLKISIDKKYRHYFYGSTKETLEKLQSEIKEKYGDVYVVGKYSPPFRALTQEEDLQIVDNINKANPDFVWVGLGAPKQENWMYNHKGKVNALMVGVGAAFDYLAGNISRAPKWMQKLNLEWLYRLMQDPIRLFSRYLYTNTKFLIYAVLLKR